MFKAAIYRDFRNMSVQMAFPQKSRKLIDMHKRDGYYLDAVPSPNFVRNERIKSPTMVIYIAVCRTGVVFSQYIIRSR